MKNISYLLSLVGLVCLTGCGTLIPKRVELFQDKVKKFPEVTQAAKETQRQAALRAKEKANETLVAAVAEKASPFVISPAAETVVLTDAVSLSVGPPVKKSTDSTEALVDELRKSIAVLAKKVDSFKEDSNENVGKKIEGTGFVQVPYFVWLGGAALLAFVGFHVLKLVLAAASAANPGAMVGVGAMNVASSTASRGLVQVVNGGKRFVKWANDTVEDPVLRQNILDAFVDAHKKAQDEDIQTVVKPLLK